MLSTKDARKRNSPTSLSQTQRTEEPRCRLMRGSSVIHTLTDGTYPWSVITTQTPFEFQLPGKLRSWSRMVTNSAQATMRTPLQINKHIRMKYSPFKKSNRDASMAVAAHIYNPSAPELEVGLQ